MFKVKALGGFDQLIIDNILKLMNDAGLIPMANDVDLQAIKYEPCFQNFKRFHKIRANCHQLAHGHPTPVAASMVFNYLSLAGTPSDPKPVSLGQFIEKIDIEILGEPLVQSVDTHPQPLVKEVATKGYYDGCRKIDWDVDNHIQVSMGKVTDHEQYAEIKSGSHRFSKPPVTLWSFDWVDARMLKDMRGDDTLRRCLGMSVPKEAVTETRGETEVKSPNSLGITPEQLNPLVTPKPKAVELRTHDKLIGFSYEVMDDLFMINREYGISEVGNPYQGAWVCRKFHTGEYVDHDRYRNDLFERLNVKGNQ